MASRVLPQDFAAALAAAGLIHDIDRIAELKIIAKPGQVVTIEVTYMADDRVFSLAKPVPEVRKASYAVSEDMVRSRAEQLGITPEELIQSGNSHGIPAEELIRRLK